MRILIATDAWRPQVNGVVRTYERLEVELLELGAEVAFVTPNEFRSVPCPTYPEIRLALPGYRWLGDHIARVQPDAIHIATEGPVGWMTRRWCIARQIPFISAFHTRFPEYLSARFNMPEAWTYAWLRRFHNAGSGLLVASETLSHELERRGFTHLMPWSRGVDTAMFRPRPMRKFGEGPVFIYVGRVAVEKNLEAFLGLDLPGRKVVVGSGPMLDGLMARHPDVLFTGKQIGEELAESYASADVFVFPSLTDTFGIVLLEAMAAGLPVAAYPVTGPRDNVRDGVSGVLDHDLRAACLAALKLDRTKVRAHAATFSWETAGRQFLSNVESALFAAQGRRVPARRMTLARRRTSSA